ncbi:cation-transporting ATPase [uncultured Microbacterium sp.]|uniref:cation-transporting ATPase n=1 Tax=uncultured Microbacterium sp. TaxID=191216 RepID=UPI0028DBF0BF|nr:cation-transporting ATPase [uncultured Microbacterium sp.]
MGKLTRLLGMAAQALDLDGSDRDRRPAGSRPAEHRSPSPAPGARPHAPYAPPPAARAGDANRRGSTGSSASGVDADRAAIARYDYLLRTADPHQVEQIHREAFERLTPAQRTQVEERMRAELPPHERPVSASPAHLARSAGRAEAAAPGRMRGLLSRVRPGRGSAAGLAGGAALGVLGVVAGGAVLSTVGGTLLEQAAGMGVDFTALAEGIDLDALAGGIDVEGIPGSAEGVLGSAGDAVSGLGETASGWGEKLGDLGLHGIRDLFGR